MNKKRLSTISHQLLATTRRGRFALVNRRFSLGPLADSENRARFVVRRCCAAFLVLSTVGYLSAVALAKADQLSAPARVEASAEARADRSAQLAPTWKPRQKEPLEKYDMPPMHIYRLETSPRMISQFGVFTSYQANVDANGQNIIGDAANECSISVDPTNPSKMAIGWRQFNDVNSNFRQGGWGYTTNGGVTWTFPGVLENNVFRSDPVTHYNETGNFFYLSLQSNQQQSFFCDDLWRSINGGQSWVLLSGERGGGGGDKQWFTIDKTGGPGHGFQYQADDGINCSGGGVQFQRSTNGGVTWQKPIVVPHGPADGPLDVDTNGNLFIGGGRGELFSLFLALSGDSAGTSA